MQISPENQPSLPEGIQLLERGWLSSNNVFLSNQEELICVDTGYVSHSEQTLALIREHTNTRSFTHVINTHLHSDHCGGNAAIQSAYPSVRVLIPAGQFDDVLDWRAAKLTFDSTGQRCPRFIPHGSIQDGDVLRVAGRDWRAIHAPGHDPHAIMLWQAQTRVLISADALWENGFGIVFPELYGKSGFSDVGETLNCIEDLKPRIVLPGHGSVIFDVPGALQRARNRLTQFTEHPAKHTHHALKALMKFLLLDRQTMPWIELKEWVLNASLMKDTLDFGVANGWSIIDATAVNRWKPDTQQEAWLATALEQLVASGALRIERERILNA